MARNVLDGTCLRSFTVDVASEEALVPLAAHLDVRFVSTDGNLEVILEGEDVSGEIRTQEVANAASQVAAFPRVREALLRRQRGFREAPGLIADGRDMGTVVFPDAPVKIFLDASSEERAQRRMLQLQEKGFSVNFDRLLSEIKERDDRDRNRAVAPLVPAQDALVLDSTGTRVSATDLAVPPLQWIDGGYVKQPHPARSQVDVNINLKIKHD